MEEREPFAVMILRAGRTGRVPVLVTDDPEVVQATLNAVRRTLNREEAETFDRDPIVA